MNTGFDFSFNDTVLSTLLLVFAAVWLIQMVYFWAVFSRLGFYKSPPVQDEKKPVSVVIAARNEYYHLSQNLPLILAQDYPDFEVVVVNDASDDETGEYLKYLAKEHTRLNIVNITSHLNFFKGKKFPLALGIKSAKHEYLLLTDADCRPASPRWIDEMQSRFKEDTQFVLGYGGYKVHKGLLNKLIRWDTLIIAMQYFSFALAGQPYMGVGRNLAYRKSFFNACKGFASHYQISSGDDDLHVNKHATRSNTRICVSPAGFTYSEPPESFGAWVKQKRRHFSTGFYYKLRHKIMLGTWAFTQFLFYALMVFLLIRNFNVVPVCILFVLRLISQLMVIKNSMKVLQEKNLLLLSPLFEVFFILFNAFLMFSNIINREHQWK